MTKSLVERQFGQSARHYAECEVHAKGESLALLLKAVAPKPGWHVLDVATGAGHTALLFAPHVRSVIASDLTEEMLAETARLAGDRGLSNVTTARAAADDLPFEDDAFDLVTCRLAAHHFPDIGKFVSESRRVLKPGGKLAIADNVNPDESSLAGRSAEEIAKATAAYNGFETLRDPSHARAWSLSEWQGALASQGFSGETAEVVKKEMAFTPWFTRMHCDPDTVQELRRLLETPSDLSEFLCPRRDDDDLHLTLREAVIVARKS